MNDSAYSALSLFIDETILRHVQKCTEMEGRRVLGTWNCSVEGFEKFVGLCYASGVFGCTGIPIKELWSKPWEIPILSSVITEISM